MIVQKTGFDYDFYVTQQGKKANNPRKRESFIRTRQGRIRKFQSIFMRAKGDLRPGRILCLGARTGCEVQAARNCGFTGSMGIDLHPVGELDLVREGDWHNIPFKSAMFDNAFTNSIDHCYDVVKMAREVNRVLKPGGRFLMMLSGRQRLDGKEDRENYMLHSQNFLFWEDGKDLAEEFEKYGFKLITNWEQGTRWTGYVLEKVAKWEKA